MNFLTQLSFAVIQDAVVLAIKLIELSKDIRNELYNLYMYEHIYYE